MLLFLVPRVPTITVSFQDRYDFMYSEIVHVPGIAEPCSHKHDKQDNKTFETYLLHCLRLHKRGNYFSFSPENLRTFATKKQYFGIVGHSTFYEANEAN